MSALPNLIVLGASARAASFSALRAGMQPYAIDLFADSDLADACPAVKIACYPRDFERALTAAPQAPWIYTGGLENHPDLVERMSALRPLYGNGAEVLRQVRNPELLITCFAGSIFEMPEIRNSPPPLDSEQKWLRKPRRSSGGLGILRHDAGIVKTDPQKHYFQQFVPGASRSAVYVATRSGCELLGVTDQQCGVSELPEEPFLYAGSTAFPAIREARNRLQELGDLLTRAFALRGLFNVDYVDDGRKIWPLEANPRYSASMEVLERAEGQNFLEMHVAEYDLGFPSETKRNLSRCSRHSAKRIVYATCDCLVTPDLNLLRKAWNIEPSLPNLADIPRPGDRIVRGQPVATVFAEGDSQEEVERLVQARVQAVEQTLLPV